MNATPKIIRQSDSLNRDTLISKTISALRWPLAVLVVVDHYFRLHLAEAVTASCNPSQADIISITEAFIISFFKNYPVPIFFFISGYLLYLGKDYVRQRYLTKLRKLPRGIIFPYVFWTVYAIGVYSVISVATGEIYGLRIPTHSFTGGIRWLIYTFIGQPWPANLPLWYVRDLLLLILLSPVIHKLLTISKGWAILLFGLAYMFITNDNNAIRLQTGLFFFSLGYWLRYTGTDVISLSHRLFRPALFLYFAGAAFYFVNYDIKIDDTVGMPLINCMAKNLAVIGFLVICFHVVSRLIAYGTIKAVTFLPSASFFIYVAHYPLIHVVFKLWSDIFGGYETSGNYCLAIVCAATFITPGALTLIYYLMRKSMPSFVNVIDGR